MRGMSLYEALLGELTAFWYGWYTVAREVGSTLKGKAKARSQGVIHLAKALRLMRGVLNYSGILSWGISCAQICISEK